MKNKLKSVDKKRGSSINDVTVLWEVVNGFVTTSRDGVKGEGSKIINIYVTSFM